MNKIPFLLPLIIYSSYGFAFGVDRQAIYTYSSVNPAIDDRAVIGRSTIESVRIDLTKSALSRGRPIYWKGHAGVGSKLCDTNSNYYCFFNPALTFSVPKEHIKIGASWIFNGLDFKVTESVKFRIFGKKVPMFIISSKFKSAHKAYFLYSELSGLMGLSFSKTGDNYYFYFLEGKIGFPF